MRKASRNLETYLVKRVSDVMYQARLDAVKLHENCTDDVAKTIELTEEQYLSASLIGALRKLGPSWQNTGPPKSTR